MVTFDMLSTLFPGVVAMPCGSNALPYIINSRDNDYLLICQSEEQRREVLKFRTEHLTEWRQLADIKVHTLTSMAEDTRIWIYIHHFLPTVPGIKRSDIYVKHDEVLTRLYDYYLAHPDFEPTCKGYYHVYTDLAMWRNGNYELTPDDIARINRFHDCCATQEDYDLMIQMLNEEVSKSKIDEKA